MRFMKEKKCDFGAYKLYDSIFENLEERKHFIRKYEFARLTYEELEA